MRVLAITAFLLGSSVSVHSAPDINPHTSQEILKSQRDMEDRMRELQGRIESLEHQLKVAQSPSPSASKEIGSGAPSSPPMTAHGSSQGGKSAQAQADGTRYFSTPPQADPIPSTAEDKFKKARELITLRRYDQAEALLRELTQENPKNKLAIDAHYWLGEIAFINGKDEAAAVSFGESYRTYELIKKMDPSAKDSKAPNSLIQLARCLNKMGQRKKALTTLNQLEREFPHHPKKIISVMAQRARKEIEDRRPRKAHL